MYAYVAENLQSIWYTGVSNTNRSTEAMAVP